jgi:hypothetical protein
LYVHEEDIKDAANRSPKALGHLRDYGGDGRIAHQVFIIMEDSWASSFTGGTRWDVSISAGSISIKAGGGSTVSGKSTVTLTPGTGLAYLLLKPEWNKGKNQIEDTHVDEWSLN